MCQVQPWLPGESLLSRTGRTGKGEKRKKKSTKLNCCFEGKRERQRLAEGTKRSEGPFLSLSAFRARVQQLLTELYCLSQPGLSPVTWVTSRPHPPLPLPRAENSPQQFCTSRKIPTLSFISLSILALINNFPPQLTNKWKL